MNSASGRSFAGLRPLSQRYRFLFWTPPLVTPPDIPPLHFNVRALDDTDHGKALDLRGALQVRALDADRQKVLTAKTFPVEILAPQEYVEVDGVTYAPGGMASKLAAAKMAAWSGVRTVIAAADRPGVLAAAVDGEAGAGTVVRPHDRKLSARKLTARGKARSDDRHR